jgi:glyoxalase family protein
MNNQIKGLHHITAIASDAQRNYDFYTRILGLRMVKKTVNFDDPQTYHFYFGDEQGTPGTILTFFPWTHARAGKPGTGMATEIGYAVPADSLDFWQQRFKEMNVPHGPVREEFGDTVLPFSDPDGLQLKLVVPANADPRKPWTTNAVNENKATRGFHSVALSLKNTDDTAKILTDIFGYNLDKQENNRYRFKTDVIETANLVDLILDPEAGHGINAAGTNHHVAFRVSDEEVLMHFREKILSAGFNITPRINRDYFFSLYFREPGGVLFELATDNPGFATDETVENLGTSLRLPKQYEQAREQIEKLLPKLTQA